MDVAVRWLGDYLDSEVNKTSPTPYAYPAYDNYNDDENDSNRISDADLLAPLLLNVKLSLRTYYALQHVRDRLEPPLGEIEPALMLADVADADIAAKVKPLYAVLDGRRPSGVQSTTLSKILHRKRPQFLVLHDKWVKRCYWGSDAPVHPEKARSNSDYMVAISNAIASDVRGQEGVFGKLFDRLPQAQRVSRVRLVDILAWMSKGEQP
jgi:Family of unknown function (DUF6308)